MENHYDREKERKDVRLEREDSGGSSSSSSSGYGFQSTESFPILDVLEIMKESMRLMRKRSSLLMSLTASLIMPLSFIVLSHILVTHSLVKGLAVQIEAVCQRGPSLESPLDTFLYLKLSEVILSSVVYLPFCIILFLPSKVAISYTVVSAYAGRKLSMSKSVRVVPRLWKRVVSTYLWICLVGLGALAAIIFLLAAIAVVTKFLRLDSTLLLLMDLLLAVTFCFTFALLLVLCNLSLVVSILEDVGGYAALSRGLILIQGRTQVALGLLMVTGASGIFIEYLFQSHILGNPEEPFQDISSILWEGPLLIFMYSVVYMFDAIMATIFYFTCKGFRFEAFDKYALLEQLEGSNLAHTKNLPL